MDLDLEEIQETIDELKKKKAQYLKDAAREFSSAGVLSEENKYDEAITQYKRINLDYEYSDFAAKARS